MGKIISLINVTPDGFVDIQYAKTDAEFFELTHELIAETKTLAFGRTTFELFEQVWEARLANKDAPDWQLKMAQAMHDTPKQVYSTGLESTTWNNSTIVKKIDVDFEWIEFLCIAFLISWDALPAFKNYNENRHTDKNMSFHSLFR